MYAYMCRADITLLRQSSLNQCPARCIQHCVISSLLYFCCSWKGKVCSVKHNFLPFLFPWWNIQIYFDICCETCYLRSTGQGASSTCKLCTIFTWQSVCVYTHTSSKNTQSRQFSILFLPRTSFWKLSSLNCCPLSFIACHTLWHLAPVLPHSPQTKSRRSFRVSARRDGQLQNVTWISQAATTEAWINHFNLSIHVENTDPCCVQTELLSLCV